GKAEAGLTTERVPAQRGERAQRRTKIEGDRNHFKSSLCLLPSLCGLCDSVVNPASLDRVFHLRSSAALFRLCQVKPRLPFRRAGRTSTLQEALDSSSPRVPERDP